MERWNVFAVLGQRYSIGEVGTRKCPLTVQVLNKNSLFIPVTLESESKTIKTLGLIDSGAGGKFIDQNFAKE